MMFSLTTALSLWAAFSVVHAVPAPRSLSLSPKETYAALALQADATLVAKLAKQGGPSCNLETVAIRRAFQDLSQPERKEYTDAVLCLQSLPQKTPSDVAPGVQNRYDDFVATHINQTLTIHYTGTFLGWHRYFTWIYEKALREECGYTGYQPYWDWPLFADAPQDSPIFNGDAYSMSGNGEYIPHDGTVISLTVAGIALPNVTLEPGLGGGCVTTGPFANMQHHVADDLSYAPRCATRDIGPFVSQKYTNYTGVATVLSENNNIADFQLNLQGNPANADIGCHGGGHYTVNGDEGDLFTSPSDPIFYLHHAQIDRMWTIWQALDPSGARYDEVAGTGTFLNAFPSPNTTLADTISLGYVGAPVVTLGDVVSTTAGPFCYLYA